MWALQVPWAPEALFQLAGERRISSSLQREGLDPLAADRYAERLSRRVTSQGPINWYRALPLDLRRPTAAVQVPTLFVWGERDRYLTRAAALGTGRHVTGAYSFEILEGAGHWIPELESARLAPILLAHLDS
jgi:pimeloyl-ACP methyl ester carboxylesterase